MKKLLSATSAGKILISGLSLLMVFHLLILMKIVPANIVWGGQIEASPDRFLMLELIAIFLTALFLVIAILRFRSLHTDKSSLLLRLGTWLIFAYLVLNIAGNLALKVTVETIIFTPVTVILAFCAFRLAGKQGK
jgi:hypothetical protein